MNSAVPTFAAALFLLPIGCVEMGAGQQKPTLPFEPGIYTGVVTGIGEARYYFNDGTVFVEPLSIQAHTTFVIANDGLPVPDGRGLYQQFGPFAFEFYPISEAAADNGYTSTYDFAAGWLLPDGSVIPFDGTGTDTLLRIDDDSMMYTRQWFMLSLDGTIQITLSYQAEVSR